MKRWHVIALVIAILLVVGYFYVTRGGFHLGGTQPATASSSGSDDGLHPSKIVWQTVSRPDDGFKLEMPADPRDLQVPAFNETGGSEPIKMLFSSPDGDTTFAISWEDNPPVARVNKGDADRTLDQARDGMMERTQTTRVKESRLVVAGFPARDITAKNNEGGYLDARLIYANNRLYTLMALYPSISARREQDVIRFFNSFTPGANPARSSS